LSRPQAVISFMEMPKAPSPAKPDHRRVGLADLGAEDRRQAVAAGTEQAGREVFAALLEGRVGVADGAVVADVGRDDRFLRQGGLDGAPGLRGDISSARGRAIRSFQLVPGSSSS
jgi:hypothetical protein